MLTDTAVCNNTGGILVINLQEKIPKAVRCSRKQMVAIRAVTFAQWVQVSPAPEFGLDPPPPPIRANKGVPFTGTCGLAKSDDDIRVSVHGLWHFLVEVDGKDDRPVRTSGHISQDKHVPVYREARNSQLLKVPTSDM